MPDDKTKTGGADRKRVAGGQKHEVDYVAKKTGKPAAAVKTATEMPPVVGTPPAAATPPTVDAAKAAATPPAAAKPAPATPPAAAAAAKPVAVPHQQIAERAYQLWQARGGSHGHDLEHWLEAEGELRSAKRKA